MIVSLLRAHTLGAYGYGGGYEPGMGSESGFGIGQERTLHYAIAPHRGDWRDAKVWRVGMELNNPLIAGPPRRGGEAGVAVELCQSLESECGDFVGHGRP